MIPDHITISMTAVVLNHAENWVTIALLLILVLRPERKRG